MGSSRENLSGGAYTEGLGVPIYTDPTRADFDKIRALLSIDPRDKTAFLNNAYGERYKTDRLTSVTNMAPFSLINRYALFTWMGLHGSPKENFSQFYRNKLDPGAANQLVSPYPSREPTTQNIIEFFTSRNWGGMEYAWSDFLWAKFHNTITNNHLLTLRRFTAPCEDNIYSVKKSILSGGGNASDDEIGTAEIADITAPDIARAVGWMGEDPGNVMGDILNFGYGYNWKEQTAETNTQESQAEGYTAQPFYSKLGTAGGSFFDLLRGINPGEKQRAARKSGHDPMMETYENFVIGPVNVVNKMQTRDVGLNFEQDIKINFQYELKQYEDLNPKVALLDIFTNLLVLTYSNANFWGGANRFYGGAGYVAARFGDTQLLANGKTKEYLNSIVTDLSSGFKDVFSDETGTLTQESVEGGFKSFGGAFLGNMLQGFLNKQTGAAPAFQALKGFITGEPTGNWHLTVGNPMNPIVMLGNLILDSSTIRFEGPLGYDDFPTNLVLEVNLKHGRPRDKSDFESAFNAGKGRMYASPEGFADFLNISGSDIDVYGAFQTSTDAAGEVGGGGDVMTAEDAERAGTGLGTSVGASDENAKKVGQYAKWAHMKTVGYMDSVDRMIHY